MKDKILKILEDCKHKGYDDLHFEKDREYIANAIIENGTLIDLPFCRMIGKVYRKEVFLTKPEAEKKLKEQQNER